MSKKEKEKKRKKSKQEKAEKRAERKLNNNKGKGLDAMTAYVDEFGNLSSTPPDPKKKVEIDPETIQLGAAPVEPIDASEIIRTGVVTFFNEAKGYGFIHDTKSQESIFVHVNDLLEPITDKDKVTFEIKKSPKGLAATSVKKEVKK